jgi:hypothetical protein
VLQDKIKIARGEAQGFVEEGLVARDLDKGTDKMVPAKGVVFATGYEVPDLPKRLHGCRACSYVSGHGRCYGQISRATCLPFAVK